MAGTVCWACERSTHVHLVGAPYVYVEGGPVSQITAAALFGCDNCSAVMLGMSSWAGHPGDVDGGDWVELLTDADAALDWYPNADTSRHFAHVPAHIASAASEAYRCHGIGAERAAVMLARAVVEATAKACDITSGTLYAKITALREQGLIRVLIEQAAHKVRQFGNEMAHGDFIEPISKLDADLVLTLMSKVLDEVFQTPAQVAAVEAAVHGRKGSTPPATVIASANLPKSLDPGGATLTISPRHDRPN
jgi:hypothetical protein